MKISAVKTRTMFLSILPLAVALPGIAADTPPTTVSVSSVRIVRLSEVRGTVEMDRAIGRGFEAAIANLPIIEQSKVRTGEGAAEVEFEDNSTLRIGPHSLVEFPQLGRTATGRTTSTVRLVQGTAYVSLMKLRTDEFTILFGNRQLALPPAAHIRLEITPDQAELAVLGGALRIDESTGSLEVPKKNTISFDLKDQKEPIIAKKIVADPLDEWDKQSTEYHVRGAGFGRLNSPYVYGSSDLAYYGVFDTLPGCGFIWRPYFASAAWDPYSNGAWAWYSNSGYSWVSPYPWGWMPYHYGSWTFCPHTGWGWTPGRTWYGLQNGTNVVLAPKPVPIKPVPIKPVRPPRPGDPTILVVNTKPLVRSGIASPSSFQFRSDSAGLGIPRQTLGKLSKFSEHAASRGISSTRIYVAGPTSITPVPSRASANRAAASGTNAGGTMHRGYAPSAPAQAGFSGGARSGNSAPTSVSPSYSPNNASSPSSGAGGSRR